MQVSVESYAAFRRRGKSQRAQQDERIGNLIEVIFHEHKRRYGVRRIGDELKERGIHIGRQRVSRLMNERGLVAKGRKKFRVTTDSEHSRPIAENTLNRDFSPPAPNHAWCGDISYIWTDEGWMYLAVFLDLYSRAVVGWALSKRLKTDFVLLAFQKACARRIPKKGLVIHTDRGTQYASHQFRSLLSRGKCRLSMSRKGNCWDNAVAESFFARLKVELIHGERFHTREQLENELFDYIENFYNSKRKHSSLHYLSPFIFERNRYYQYNKELAA